MTLVTSYFLFLDLKHSLNSSIVLQHYLKKPIIIPSSSFKDEKELETIILDIFPNAELQQVLIHQSFPSLIDLLKNIKFTGVKTTTFHDKTIWSPSFLKKLEEVYLQDIVALVQLIKYFIVLQEKRI